MNRRTGIVAAVLVLVLAALAIWRLGQDAPPEPPPEPGPRPEEPAQPRKRPPRPAPKPAPEPPRPPPIPEPASAPSADEATVRVVEDEDADAAGVAGATVVLVSGDETLTLETDADGGATVPARLVGALSVWAWAPGRSTAHADVVVSAGAELRMALPTGRAVRVRLVDAAGAPLDPEQVGGAPDHVELLWNGALAGEDPGMFFRTLFGPAAAWRTRVDVRADASGLELARPVGPGTWRLFVPLPSGVPVLSEPFRGDGEGELVVDVRVPDATQTSRIRVVTEGSGEPVPGARLRAYFEYGDDQAFIPGVELVTDERGEVVVPVDPRPVTGTGSRRTRPPQWWAETDTHVGNVRGVLAAGAVKTLRVRPYAVVEGEAYTAGGEPAAGALVLSYEDGRAASAIVAADGSYRIERVYARSGGRKITIVLIEDLARLQHVEAEHVAVAPGETARLVIGSPDAANEGGRVVGRLHAGPLPLAGVYVVVEPAGGGSATKGRFGRTDVEGRITLEGVPAGAYRLQVFFGDPRVSDDHSLRRDEPLQVEAGMEEAFDYDLPDGALRVRVFDAGTGLPLSAAGVSARPSRDVARDRFPGHHYRPGWAAFADDEGEALLLALVPGEDHELRVFADGYEPRSVAGQVPGTLSEPGVVEVRLTKSN